MSSFQTGAENEEEFTLPLSKSPVSHHDAATTVLVGTFRPESFTLPLAIVANQLEGSSVQVVESICYSLI